MIQLHVQRKIAIVTIGFFMMMNMVANAQINPSPSQYFGNRLFQNVSATGMEKGLRFDAVYRNMTPNTFAGSPVNTLASIQGGLNDRSGVGMQFQNERAGLLNRSRMALSYALDLSKGETRVRLGVGVGMMMTRVNTNNGNLLRGEMNDPTLAAFNQNRVKIDGTIGMLVETKKGWEIMAALPSLGTVQEFKSYNAIDYIIANAMVSKKIKLSKDEQGEVFLQPMLGYRLMQGVEDVLDAGAMLKYKNLINFLAIYHSNKEMALGVGIPFKDKLSVNFTYNTGKVYTKNYLNVGGTLEAHLMYRF
ncbi:MAG: PorP/SprF family type IX secretion system membrane protein [bacterium]